MTLEQKDIELIERLIYKNNDDVAVSIARSFERLEERIDAAESRLYSRFSDLEDRVEACRQDISDDIGTLRDEVRELTRMDDED
ncbi:MAG: hypothetical protein WCO48_03150 [Candidatus Taylorbacteria bacterium]